MKRRLCRMLLLTISFRKSRGELRGDSLGEVALRFPPPTPGILGGSSSRCMCSLNVRMQESISTLSSLDDIPASLSVLSASSGPNSHQTAGVTKLYTDVKKPAHTHPWVAPPLRSLSCFLFSVFMGLQMMRPAVVLSPTPFSSEELLSTELSHTQLLPGDRFPSQHCFFRISHLSPLTVSTLCPSLFQEAGVGGAL